MRKHMPPKRGGLIRKIKLRGVRTLGSLVLFSIAILRAPLQHQDRVPFSLRLPVISINSKRDGALGSSSVLHLPVRIKGLFGK